MESKGSLTQLSVILGIFALLAVSCIPVSYPENQGPRGPGYQDTNVPYVSGQQLDDARQMIFRNDLRVGNINYLETRNRHLNGKVESQYPRAGVRVRAGSAVDLTVYRLENVSYPPHNKPGWNGGGHGAQRIRVPNLKRLSLENAESTIRNNYLRTGRITYESTHNRNLNMVVINQNPASGTLLEKGTVVDLVVYRYQSAPPPQARERMPNLTGMQLPQAERTIQSRNLRLGKVRWVSTRNWDLNNQVKDQSPAPGRNVNRGDTVKLKVYQFKGRRPEPSPQGHRPETSPGHRPGTSPGHRPEAYQGKFIVVPNVIGKDIDIAKKFITNSGLSVGSVKKDKVRRNQYKGIIVRQNPAPGTRVKHKSSVDLWVDNWR